MRRLLSFFAVLFISIGIITGLLIPVLTISASSTDLIEIILEEPTYHPPLGACDETYWYSIPNDRGYNAYLTLNAYDPVDSTNWAEWIPFLPDAGYYRVEAYVTSHDPITWCTGGEPTINDDTTDARYTVHHAFGETVVSRDQSPLANEWLDLGEYFFNSGYAAKVILTDLNGEDEFTTTVSFSAMRFTWIRQPPHMRVLPILNRNLEATPSVQPTPWVGIQSDPAFDACHMGGVATMQTWWDSSPYTIVGLYLGGISYPTSDPVNCTVITSDWVQQVRNMGWSFIPTWVGLQAPCTSYKHQMDEDPQVSYLQGRDEADQASRAAKDLGLTNYDLGGTIIYYDLEAFGSISEDCKLAVDAFMNGWTQRLHELGNQSGAYGSSCSSYPTRWVTLENPPDDVWLAYWTEEEYDPDQTVYSLPCFDDKYYTNHQRIKQYAGGHDESWGGKTLEIDSNVADSSVAIPELSTSADYVTSTARTLLSTNAIQQTGWLSFQDGWVVSVGRLFRTNDRGISWQDQGLMGIQRASYDQGGSAWAAGGDSIYRKAAEASVWEKSELPQHYSGWRVVQLGHHNISHGWLVIQRPTSTIFNIGRLLTTSDGGINWQVYSMPFAAAITWAEGESGWISGGVSGRELSRTEDGGKTWQSVKLPDELVEDNAPVFLSQIQYTAGQELMFYAVVSHVKIPTLFSFTSRDDGHTWLSSGMIDLMNGAPLTALSQTATFFADGQLLRSQDSLLISFADPIVDLGSNGHQLIWAVTRQSSCLGQKGQPGFTCSSRDMLWFSTDRGENWSQVLP